MKYSLYYSFQVVTSAVRQLKYLPSDQPWIECIDLFVKELKKPGHLSGAGGPVSKARSRSAVETAYQKQAEQILHLDNCFKIVVVSISNKLFLFYSII